MRYQLHPPLAGEMFTILPEAERPTARIIHRVVTEEDVRLENLRAAVKGRPDRICPPGTYTILHTQTDGKWEVMMSDAPYEIRSSEPLIENARGHVLIAGLGLAVTTLSVLRKPEVESVTVIEKSQDVYDLVYPHILNTPHGMKLVVEIGDARTWKPERRRFNTIWLDIWPTISGDNLPEITKLKRRYSRWLDRKSPAGAWMGVWEEWYLRREQRAQVRLRQGHLEHRRRQGPHLCSSSG